jgi:hypothetical protein
MTKIIERRLKADELAWRNGGLIDSDWLVGEFRTCVCVCVFIMTCVTIADDRHLE